MAVPVSVAACLSVLLPLRHAAAAEACGARSKCLLQRLAVVGPRRASSGNLCVQGRLVPELFVLGAQKAGTSFLWEQLQSVGGVWAPQKEAQVFDKTPTWELGLERWAHGYPECITKARVVSMDCTPGYLFSEDAARRISARYGEHAHRLKFAIVLREPLARTQSAFYYYRETAAAWARVNADAFQASFQSYVEGLLGANGTHYLTPALEDPFWNSRYHAQISGYFELFDSSQFTLATFRSVVGRDSFAQHLASWVGLAPTVAWNYTGPVNANSHPSLPEDLEPPVLQRVLALVEARAGPAELGALLAGARGRGAALFEFGGDRASGASVAEWLSSSW